MNKNYQLIIAHKNNILENIKNFLNNLEHTSVLKDTVQIVKNFPTKAQKKDKQTQCFYHFLIFNTSLDKIDDKLKELRFNITDIYILRCFKIYKKLELNKLKNCIIINNVNSTQTINKEKNIN